VFALGTLQQTEGQKKALEYVVRRGEEFKKYADTPPLKQREKKKKKREKRKKPDIFVPQDREPKRRFSS